MFSKRSHSRFVVDLCLTLFRVWQEQKEQRNIVGRDKVGLLGELFMLPYCTSPHLGLPRPHPSVSDAKHVTYKKREIFQGQVFWEFSACPNKHYSMFRQ